MLRSAKFWVLMLVFQAAFGLTVFAVTRHYYINEADQVSTSPRPARQATPEWPELGKGSDLENLIATFPGQTPAGDPAAMMRQADDLFGMQQYGKAAVLYQKVLDAGSKDANTYNNLGITLHYLGRPAEALQVLNEGVATDPSYQRIWLTLGFVNSQLGNTAQAREALTTAVQMDASTDVGQSATQMLNALGPG